jgi:DNA damage-binding protein 1
VSAQFPYRIDQERLISQTRKANRLEFYTQTTEGLTLQFSKAIYGKVVVLQKLRPASSPTDLLFVGTDRYVYFTLAWDAQKRQLRTEKSMVDVAERSSRESQTGERCLIDPSSRIMTLEFFEGILTVVPIVQKTKKKSIQGELGDISDPIPYRISEMFVRSSVFLQPRQTGEKPKIALLYEDTQGDVRIQLRKIEYPPGGPGGDMGTGELDVVKGFPTEPLTPGASHLIPVSSPGYGLMVLGETSISYVEIRYSDDLELESNGAAVMIRSEPLDDATIFVCWTQIDEYRFVLADEYGKLYLLMLVVDEYEAVYDWRLDVLGTTSHASTLVYLDAGHIFVGSHQGDSQVIRITEKSLEVVQNFANIAPILDFTVMDMGNRSTEGQSNEYSSGQARIVTGSGAYKDGSLRSVRSGVGMQELGILTETQRISGLFRLKTDGLSEYDDILIASFDHESRVFKFTDDGEVEELDQFQGMNLSSSTLLALNLPQGRFLHITSSEVRITDLESGMMISDWKAPSEVPITMADANDTSALLSAGGVNLINLELGDTIQQKSSKDLNGDSQISCISLTKSNQIAFVGLWHKSEVALISLSSLEPLRTISVSDGSVPRSLKIAQIFEQQLPTLFIAMSDGHVLTYSVDLEKSNSDILAGRQSIILGSEQPHLTVLPRSDTVESVFAACEHPTLIYASEGRLVYSAVTAERSTAISPFNAAAFPGSIVVATKEDLRVALIDKERTTHVQTLLVHETVRRIAYSPEYKAFGLGTIKRTLKNSVEKLQSNFKLADEIQFKELDSFNLNSDELIETVMRCELRNGSGELEERFVVGTAYLDDEHSESVRGRILVFEVVDRLLKLVTELSTKGACRCLAICKGRIVAGLMKTVSIVYPVSIRLTTQCCRLLFMLTFIILLRALRI